MARLPPPLHFRLHLHRQRSRLAAQSRTLHRALLQPRRPTACRCEPPAATAFHDSILPSVLLLYYLMDAPTMEATLTGPAEVVKGAPLYTATQPASVVKSGCTCGLGQAGVWQVHECEWLQACGTCV
jgi:hypothetical protein